MQETIRMNGLKITGDRKDIIKFQDHLLKLEEKTKDNMRLDWLASTRQNIGNVQLPMECVESNLTSLRGAIDDAMRIDIVEKEKGFCAYSQP